jgi:hypothetical protein
LLQSLFFCPNINNFHLNQGRRSVKNFPLRMMYTLGRKPQDWRIGSVPQVYEKNANGYGGRFMRELSTAPVI